MSLATIEQYFIDDIKAAFNGRLKGVESLPAQWDARTFERIFRATPGVFVVFAGGQRLPQFEDGVVLDGTWVFAAVTTHASGELARRRGDSHEIGAYEILEILAARYEGAIVPGAPGPMHVDDAQNLFDDAIENQGAALYALTCRLPTPLAPGDGALPVLDDFLTFPDQVDLAPVDGQPEAADLVELDQ
jgi:phage gp37-like protein